MHRFRPSLLSACLCFSASAAAQQVAGWEQMGLRNIDDLREIRALDANAGNYLAIRADGTLAFWGDDSTYLADNGFGLTTLPSATEPFREVALGSFHALALTESGSVRAWGFDGFLETIIPQGLLPCTAIAAGTQSSIAIQNNGVLRKWGQGAAAPADLGACVQASAGYAHFTALQSAGTVRCWGSGAGATTPADLGNCTAVKCGSSHTVALLSTGAVRVWGGAEPPSGLTNVVAIDADDTLSVALRSDGTVAVWGPTYTQVCSGSAAADRYELIAASSGLGRGFAGKTLDGLLSAATWNLTPPPSHLGALRSCIGTYPTTAVYRATLALRADGTLASWGASSFACSIPETDHVRSIAAGTLHSAALRQDGSVVVASACPYDLCEPPPGLGFVTRLSSGEYHLSVLRDNGSAASWGRNDQGQCDVPLDLGRSVRIACGGNFTATLGTTGTLRGWGSPATAFTLATPDPAVELACGGTGAASRTLLVRANGTVRKVGGSSFAPPADLANVRAVAVGSVDAALLNDGTVRVWPSTIYTAPQQLGTAVSIDTRQGLVVVKRTCPPTVVRSSPALVGNYSAPFNHTFAKLPPAIRAVELRMTIKASYPTGVSHPSLQIDGSTFATLVTGSLDQPCPPQPRTFLWTIPPAMFNAAIAADGSAAIRLTGAGFSGGCAPNVVETTLELSYDTAEADADADGVADCIDNCLGAANPEQFDCNMNGTGDACETAAGSATDCDGDLILDACEFSAGATQDCDANGTPDDCDVASGAAADSDADGVPDGCEYARGDLTLDGRIDAADLAALLARWGESNPPYGDLSGDGLIDAADLAQLLLLWTPGS